MTRALRSAALGTLCAVTLLAGTTAIAQERRVPITPPGANVIAPYSPAIEYNASLLFVSGNIAYVDGAVPAHAADGDNDVQDQTTIIMDAIEATLASAGYELADVLKVSVFMTDIAFYGAFNEVYGTYWEGDIAPPAREAVQVAGLPGSTPDAPVLLEVSVIAGK